MGELKSIVSYPERGRGGDNRWRGNCSPELIRDLLAFFKPRKVFDPMVGSGTTRDVCRELGIEHTVLDLNPAFGGWDALNEDVPESSDFIFWHPPYHDIIRYSGEQWGNDADTRDLSRCPNYEDFISKLNMIEAKLMYSLRRGGHIAILVGDVKKNGVVRSIQKDMDWLGSPVNVMIKAQHNCQSDNKTYCGKFIPIVHEYILLFKRDDCFVIPVKRSVGANFDIRDAKKATWRDIVYAAMEYIGGRGKLKDIYDAVDGHRRTAENPYWQDKVRQVVRAFPKDFRQVSEGEYALAA